MRTLGAITLAIVAALFLVAATPSPPPPTGWVEDHAGFLTPTVRDRLDAKLASYQRVTGRHVVVWIGRSLAGAQLDDWASRAFAAWRTAGFDDGVAVFVFADDRVIDIEVGRNLVTQLPEAAALRVIHEVMAPRFEDGLHDQGIVDGVDALLTSIEGRQWTTHIAESSVVEEAPWFRWSLLGVMAAVGILLALVSVQGAREHRLRGHHRFGW